MAGGANAAIKHATSIAAKFAVLPISSSHFFATSYAQISASGCVPHLEKKQHAWQQSAGSSLAEACGEARKIDDA
jgi:hypothetical protein